MKRSIKRDFIYTFSAHGMSMMLSFILALFVPKMLGVESFSYWQLFLFYSSYVGFFHFGLDDGIYLKYGGVDLNNIDKEKINGQLSLLFILLLFIVAVLFVFGYSYIDDGYRWIVFIGVLIDIFLANLLGFWIYLFQATCRVIYFAKAVLLDRFILLGSIILFLIIGVGHFKSYIIIYLFSKFIALCYCFFLMRKSLRFRSPFHSEVIKEYIDNIRIGSNLLFANIASLLVVGISRYFIDHHWGIVIFGKVSLMLSVVNFFVLFLSQVGIVIFPVLKNINVDGRKEIYKCSNILLDVFFLGILLFYIPIIYFLNKWLPLYSDSFNYLVFLLPICVFEGKNQMLLSPYMKSFRKERLLFKLNVFSLLISFLITLLGIAIGNLGCVLISIVAAMCFKYLAMIFYFNKSFGLKKNEYANINLICVCVFILSNMFFNHSISFLAYLSVYILFLIKKRKSITHSYNQLRVYSLR